MNREAIRRGAIYFLYGLWVTLSVIVKAIREILYALLRITVFLFELCLWALGGFAIGAMIGHVTHHDCHGDWGDDYD